MASFAYEDGLLHFADEDFVLRARMGDNRATECLMSRYRALVETKARSYYLAGADHDDVVQEGMIGLYKAIRDFDSDRRLRFRSFAELCVTRQIITAVKTATRQKHQPLNVSISLNRGVSSDEGGTLIDVIPDRACENPEEVALDRKAPRTLTDSIGHMLSDLESKVLECYLEGKSYKEISSELRCQHKSIDNALQRIKRKIYSFLQE